MNFSAQGYAEMTSLLKPDIAVLEGGYAIEGALPYVNVGIILALAGIDYSRVKEPGYDPERIRQTSDVTRYISKLGAKVMSLWQNREQTKSLLQKNKDFDERSRRVFYDTDNISETQREMIRICRDCGGALRIDSSSDRGQHVLCVQIPRKACNACKEIAYQWYETANPRDFDMAFLQDRSADKYLIQNFK